VISPSRCPAPEEAALKDSVSSSAYPNVDLPAGYLALGFPTNMFTVMFALGRLPGWIAHWKEMNTLGDEDGRPRRSIQAIRSGLPRRRER
jgi:citrate synthase